jgi:hypothetical protein
MLGKTNAVTLLPHCLPPGIYMFLFKQNDSLSIARMKLFSYLRRIERARDCTILYVDTDSVLFKHLRGVSVLEEGQFLGEMTREYSEFNIIEFIAGGPKYAIKIKEEYSIVQMGFSDNMPLNSNTRALEMSNIL